MKRITALGILFVAALMILPGVTFDVNGHSVNTTTLSAEGVGAPSPPEPYLAEGVGAPSPPEPYAIA
ncbi:MAG: hypothetical protein ACRD4S_07440 [Candidatus Acidiferrales bacterium]